MEGHVHHRQLSPAPAVFTGEKRPRRTVGGHPTSFVEDEHVFRQKHFQHPAARMFRQRSRSQKLTLACEQAILVQYVLKAAHRKFGISFLATLLVKLTNQNWYYLKLYKLFYTIYINRFYINVMILLQIKIGNNQVRLTSTYFYASNKNILKQSFLQECRLISQL